MMPAGVQEVPWDSTEADVMATPAKDEAEQHAAEEKRKVLDELLAERNIAKFKLEVTVTWWESGAKLHGGGDCKLYLCDCSAEYPDLEGKGCGGFLPDSCNGLNFIVCPGCGMMWRNEQVVGEIWYRLTMQKWADVLLQWYVRLGHNSDIRIKYARDDIRTAAAKEQARNHGGELLSKVRDPERRGSSTYPLANIIRDTSAGADLRGRILAYLQA